MSTPTANLGFRTDINGLRAWAVIAVLLFHFNVLGFDAGFIGVDIFFVISGFLMTGIIAKGLDSGRFSIWQFYMARFRRIVPAVAALILVLLVLGWFWLPTPDYQALGTQSAYSLAFLSNIHYWRSAGYFDTAAHEKWLLHTWSLGVEMQFYILYPLFAALVWKLKPGLKTFFYSLLIIAVASLALSVVVSSWQPTAAFYLLPTRGWELAVGGLVYFLGQRGFARTHAKALYFTGLALWLVGFVWIDNSLPWPSGWALLPVLGTACIILAAQNNTLLMGNPLAQWLGNISYSVYLWHWPLVVALYFAGLNNDWRWISGFFALSLLLGYLSYQWVETPTRKGLDKLNFAQQLATFAALALMVGIMTVSVQLFVFDGRLPKAVEAASNERRNINPYQKGCHDVSSKTNLTTDCYYLKSSMPTKAILIGDSHTNVTFTSFGEASKAHSSNALHWTKGGCPTLKNAKFSSIEKQKGCFSFNEDAFKRLSEDTFKNTAVIMLNRTTRALLNGNEEPRNKRGIPRIYFTKEYKDGHSAEFQAEFRDALIETSCLVAQGRKAYLVRPIPEMGINVPKILSRNMIFGLGSADIKISLEEYHQRHAFVWAAQDAAAEQCGVKILNPLPYLCDDRYCYGSKNGRSLYIDDDHLSEYGNKFLVPMFEEVFKDSESH